ncbi:v-type proton atpase subunit e [Vairimorpha ceranae]|uniref:V-type proton atpase subunit e n=1 Tax=Vairimorpha ceranae TaxID=40302 RepID=A0A0F9YSR4_9MICR|nr:v-type proton atpase subunit e [Vairimorpha ceranae]KAF5140886.1 hypothetical protein G9O61_00g008760 [Vairimorpha ceranae]KKO75577.1 v-type proton atpase subunit e [Vairimorpha ceranae]
MEKLPNKDIERMITFIKHEAEEKVKEIEIKAIQEYNIEKARLVKQEVDTVEKDFKNKQKNLEIRKLCEESNIINKYKLQYTNQKNNILTEIFNDLEKQSSSEKLTEDLLQEAVNKINSKDFTVMCLERDKKVVRKVLGNVEIKELPVFALGGVIIVSRDKKLVIDNSYKSRIESIKKYYCNELNNFIFSK